MSDIRIRGARTHNLKNIDLDLPRGKLIVLTGVSGSLRLTLYTQRVREAMFRVCRPTRVSSLN